MEPKQKTQIIEVGGNKYRLSKLDARSASYIAFKSAGIVAPLMGKGKPGENRIHIKGTAGRSSS